MRAPFLACIGRACALQLRLVNLRAPSSVLQKTQLLGVFPLMLHSLFSPLSTFDTVSSTSHTSGTKSLPCVLRGGIVL